VRADVFDDIAASLVLGLHQSSKETLGILKGLNLSQTSSTFDTFTNSWVVLPYKN
jgi:hypothetical protein